MGGLTVRFMLAFVVVAAPLLGGGLMPAWVSRADLAVGVAAHTAAGTDTVVSLRRGDRIALEDLSGEVVIEGWARDELEVRGIDDEADVVVRRSGSQVRVERDDRKGRRRGVELSIRVPTWASVSVGGRALDVVARRTGGALSVNNLSGDISVSDAEGDITLRSIRGEIEVRDVRGRIDASSQSDDVTVERVQGDVTVYAGDGDITMIAVDARRIEAETQDGDIDFTGPIHADGEYGFFVHDGDVTLTIAASTSARVSASTFDGEFHSDFPVMVQRYTGGREFEFAIGAGEARIRVQVFDGEIKLLRR